MSIMIFTTAAFVLICRIRYSIEWTVAAKFSTLKNRKVSNDRELNVVLARPVLGTLLTDTYSKPGGRKVAANPRPDDTDVAVSMSG